MSISLDDLNATLAGLAHRPIRTLCAVVDVGDDWTLNRLRDGALGAEPTFLPICVPVTGLPAEVMPALLPLHAESWALRQCTARIALDDAAAGAVPSVCGWMYGNARIADLARAFQASLLRFTPDGQRFFFRHHDPRVRSCLGALLGQSWLGNALPVTHEWLHLTPDGQLQRTGGVDSIDATVSVTAAREFQVIMRCGEINKAVQLACASGWSFEMKAYQTADAALTRADSHGFTGAADRLAYMLHALTVNAHFDAHPDIRGALQEASKQQETYIRAVSHLPMEVWASAATTTLRD